MSSVYSKNQLSIQAAPIEDRVSGAEAQSSVGALESNWEDAPKKVTSGSQVRLDDQWSRHIGALASTNGDLSSYISRRSGAIACSWRSLTELHAVYGAPRHPYIKPLS